MILEPGVEGCFKMTKYVSILRHPLMVKGVELYWNKLLSPLK